MGKAIHERNGGPGGLRRGLMLYGSTAALAAALMLAEGGVGPAFAQAIGPRIVPTHAAQGSFEAPGASPTPYFEYRSGELDIIRINRNSAVLNWTTYDTAAPGGAQGNSYVNFLPEGSELRFTGGGQSFTAINRVFTTPDNGGAYRGIAIQGQVTSYLSSDGPNSVGPVGGNIWFYSPGGILATGTASFNVGSLLLSASDLANFSDQGFARTVDFTGVANPFASVILQPGSRVTLTQPNSSFAIVAPTIVQAGDVNVDGSVLYLSAEQGYLYFEANRGQVFSEVYQDAQAGNEIRHLGTTTGPASMSTDDFSIFDPQTIEFRSGDDVGVLLSGSIGYAPATDAALGPNGMIVLYAGTVSSGDLNLDSDTFIEARQVDLSADAGESLTMGGDVNGAYLLDVIAARGTLAAGAGGRIDIAGDVTFRAPDETGSFQVTAAGGDGNNPGGDIEIGGDLLLNSSLTSFGGSTARGGEIDVTIGDGGSIAVGGAMSVLSDGFASDGGNGVTFAEGGRAVVTMTGAGASLTVGGALTISAQARPFSYNCECSPPPSGSALGGYAALTATDGTISLDSLRVEAIAEAFSSGYSNGGEDLSATGGTALVSLGDSAASIGVVSISADAFGASGSTGTDGGSATGGTASFAKGSEGSLALGELYVGAEAWGGAGSNSYEGGDPGLGGDATGGTASVSFAQTPEGLAYLWVAADANGGAGGNAVEANARAGAAGGDAFGGTVTLTLTGEDTVLAGISEGMASAAAFGGEGGNGDEDYDFALQSGAGGAGGLARGGTLTITAAGGAEYRSEVSLDVNGNGGEGGSGGDAVFTDSRVSEVGAGGAGGDGIGGALSLIADGGSITGNIDVEALGIGGAGGLNGGISESYPGQGAYGSYTGGTIALTATDNGASRFDVDSAVLQASGDAAGYINIADQTTAPGAGMYFGSLSAQANGAPVDGTPTVRVSAVSNAIEVEGTAELYGDSIGLDFSGIGRLNVGGYALLSANGGDVTITHADNPGVLSIHSSSLDIYAQGSVIAEPGSVLASADYASIRAFGSVTVDDVRSLGNMSIRAEGDVTLANASAGGDMELFAGRIDLDGSHAYLPSARATITGTVTARGSILIESGGFAVFTGGSQVLSDNAITVRTGDDIIVASGASLVSDIDPYLFDTIRLLAGDINFGPSGGDLVEPIGTPIASLLIEGSLNSNGHSIFLSGDAIQATGSTITTGNLTVDVTDAPPFGPYSNDGGLLASDCRQGSACLGMVTATGNVAIGLESNGDLVSLKIGVVEFTGGAFDVRAREQIEIGANEASSLLAGSTRVSLESLQGGIVLTNVTVDSSAVAIRAGQSLDAGSSSLLSSNDILLAVGGDITVGTIDTAGKLNDGSGSPTFVAPGNFTVVESLSYGGGNDIRIDAAGAIAVTFADPGAANIEMFAGDDLYLGSTGASTGAIRLDGANVSFNNLVAGGVVHLTAAGEISGVSETNPAISTSGGIALEAGGAVSVLNLEAGTDIAIAGASVSTGALLAGGAIAVEAQGSAIVSSFDSGGSAVFTGASVDLGAGNAGDFLAVQATEGDISFGTLGATNDGVLEASGALFGGDIAVGGALSLQGGSMAIGNAQGEAGISASIGGDASFTSLGSTAGSITLDVTGDASGDVIAAAGNVGITGGLVGIGEVTAGSDLSVDAFSIGADTLSAGGDMTLALEGGASIGEAVAGSSFSLIGSELAAGFISAGSTLDVAVSRAAAITSFESGGDATLSGGVLGLGSGSVGGDLSAQANEGALDFESLTVDANAGLSATAGLSGGNVAAGGTLSLSGGNLAIGTGAGDDGLVATSGGTASFAALESENGSIALDAGGAVIGGSVEARDGVTIEGASVALDSASFGEGLLLNARSGGISGDGLYQGTGAVNLQAAQGIAIGSVDTLGEIAMTAGAEARFVELRSRDGSVGVDAGGAIVGSSVAATGSNPAGEDNVSLTAGAAITLDGAANSLNTGSFAQDDFTAQAGGELTIVGASAGRDLAFTAGAGTLSAADVAAGRDLSLTGPAVQLASGSVARNLTVEATEGDITGSGTTTAGGTIALDASGNIAIGALAADGGDLAATAGGSIGFTNMSASGAISLSAEGAITGSTLEAINGITASGASIALGDVSAGEGDARLEANDGALMATSVSGADVFAQAAGGLSLETVDASGSAILIGASVAFDAVTAGSSTAIESGSVIEGGSVSAGDFASIFAPGAITLTGLSVGDALVRSTGGVVSITNIALDGLLEAAGTGLALSGTGALRIDAEATAGNIGVTTSGDLTVNAVATGDIALSSTGGSVVIDRVLQQNIDFGGIGAESVNGGGAVSVTAANGISVLDSLSAGGALTMTAGGLVSLTGSASGQTIALQAGDLAIGSNAILGGASTQRVTLASGAPVNLGGDATGGFAVDAGEFARIRSAGDLMITALAGEGGGSAGSITVGSLTVNAGSGGQIGASGSFGLTAGGVLDVNSTLAIAGAGSGNTLMLTGDAVDLDYANAQLSVLGSANAATGRIVVNGRLIASMSAAAAADILGKTPAEIDTRLGQADTVREIELFRTANLTLEGRDAILIQNSGGPTADERRGFAVGALTVTGAQNGSTLVVINGVIGEATGNAAAQEVAVTNTLAAGSTVNGCALANIAGCFVIPEPPPPLIVAPDSVLFGTGDFIKNDEDDDEVEDGVADGKPEAPPIDTTKIDDPAGLPMIDDPVTGAGNEDLWQTPDP